MDGPLPVHDRTHLTLQNILVDIVSGPENNLSQVQMTQVEEAWQKSTAIATNNEGVTFTTAHSYTLHRQAKAFNEP